METAGGRPPQTAAASTEREASGFDPPNILWFFGAFAIAFASFAAINKIPESQRDLWEFLVSLGFFAAYALVSVVLLRTWWVPGGLAAALAVAMVPAVGYGVASLIGTFPKDVFSDPTQHFSWSVFLIGIATMIAGLVAFALTRFAFLFLTVVLAISITAQFFLPAVDSHPSGDDHLVTAIVLGAVLLAVGLVLDAASRRRDAFWLHVGGFSNVAVALAYYAANSGGNTNRGWIPMIIAGAIALLCSAPLWRGTWAAYGLLGFYAPIFHWLTNGVNANSTGYAWLLLAIGVSIFVLGFVLFRSDRLRPTWRGRRTDEPAATTAPPPHNTPPEA